MNEQKNLTKLHYLFSKKGFSFCRVDKDKVVYSKKSNGNVIFALYNLGKKEIVYTINGVGLVYITTPEELEIEQNIFDLHSELCKELKSPIEEECNCIINDLEGTIIVTFNDNYNEITFYRSDKHLVIECNEITPEIIKVIAYIKETY